MKLITKIRNKMKQLLFIALYASAASAGYAQTDNTTQGSQDPCFNVPVTVSGDSREIICDTIHKHQHRQCIYLLSPQKGPARLYGRLQRPDGCQCSKPILLREKDITKIVPQAYKVTVTSPESTVTACKDSTLDVNATINVEQETEYTGNYPTTANRNNYQLVSRKHYRKAERKLVKWKQGKKSKTRYRSDAEGKKREHAKVK